MPRTPFTACPPCSTLVRGVQGLGLKGQQRTQRRPFRWAARSPVLPCLPARPLRCGRRRSLRHCRCLRLLWFVGALGAGGINGVESPFFLAFLDPDGDSPEDTGTVGGVYFAHPELQVRALDRWQAFCARPAAGGTGGRQRGP